MENPGPNTFTCYICKNTYSKKISDEEALEKLDEEFPKFTVEQCEVVCDDCFQKL